MKFFERHSLVLYKSKKIKIKKNYIMNKNKDVNL